MAAKRILTFSINEVAPLVDEAKASNSRRCTFEQLY